jgi:GT2 family glycosyltransferase
MAKMLNVLVACMERKAPGGLHFIGEHRVLYDTSAGWGEAANALLDAAALLGGDALFLDDDVVLTPDSLRGVRAHYDAADLFGLDLHDMDGDRQGGARHTLDSDGNLADWVQPGPAYVAHVSTSAIYLKESFVQSGVRFPIWPGLHWEDVALCIDAWLHGLRVMAVPGYVHHAIVGGVGATKRHDPALWARWAQNVDLFRAWCDAYDVRGALADGRVPIDVQTVEGVVR